MQPTPAQARLLEVLRRLIAENGHAPTLDELGAAAGLAAKGTVHQHLVALETKGYIRWPKSGQRRSPRLIEVVE